LREYCQRRKWQIADEYTDTGVSGSKDSRPALNRLIADAGRGLFDGVLCWKLDRFGRSLRHLVNALAEFEARGIEFISLRDNLDLSTPSGRLQFQIIAAMAEFERTLIQERVKAGLRNARAKGKRLGRPPAIVDEARIDTLRASGASWRTIAKQTGLGVGTVHRLAQRSVKPKKPDLPPIPEDAEQTRRTILKSKRTHRDRNWIKNPLESWESPMEDHETKQYQAQIEVHQRLLHREYR
jgi:DNA invertase Pin-like site-specific DNA recombinase